MAKKAKKKNGSLITEHLTLTPMSVDELESLSVFNEDPAVKESYKKMAELVNVNPKNADWYTNWKITLNADHSVIGGAGFAGLPNENKEAVVHCSVLDYYLGNGYMAEAVNALAKQAFKYDDCVSVSVPVKTNSDLEEFSRLKHMGYRRELEDNGTVSYRIEKQQTYMVAIFTFFGLLFGIGAGLIIADSILVPMFIGLFVGFVVGYVLDIFDRKKRGDVEIIKDKKAKKKEAEK